jgi:hypothetical protein
MTVDRALTKRRTDSYPSDVKGEACALVYETNNYSQAEREMAKRYPDRHPNAMLIMRWFRRLDPERWKEMGEEREETFKTGIMEMGMKAQERMMMVLDTLPDSQIPVTTGIAMDKPIELLKLQKGGGNQMNVQFNLVTRE